MFTNVRIGRQRRGLLILSLYTVDLVHHYEILETTRFETRDFFRCVNRDNRLLRSFVYRRIGAVKADLLLGPIDFTIYNVHWSPGRRFHHLYNSHPTGEGLACMYVYRHALLLDNIDCYLFPLTLFLRNTPEYRMDEQCSFLLCPAYLCWTM